MIGPCLLNPDKNSSPNKMQMMLFKLAFAALLVVAAHGRTVSHLRAGLQQEPDTACGKGFDELVQGSKDWFKTAMEALFIHPAHKSDAGTFAPELKCWFATCAL